MGWRIAVVLQGNSLLFLASWSNLSQSRANVNTVERIRLSQRKSTLYADLFNNQPKVTLKGHIGAFIYLLYK